MANAVGAGVSAVSSAVQTGMIIADASAQVALIQAGMIANRMIMAASIAAEISKKGLDKVERCF